MVASQIGEDGPVTLRDAAIRTARYQALRSDWEYRICAALRPLCLQPNQPIP
jgi:hypothetical protein